ncbi:MAG: arsenic resistance N-acetyltransferase ArsN2 [Woeseiaceae bacterium]|nr:arsenic resistance N-acetyltransferase ArsN2 [Woeseiaceae bacterium]
MNFTLRPSTDTDLDFAARELDAAGLPVSDLHAGHLAYTAMSAGAVVGVIGMEPYGSTGLLRSLVVSRGARGSGVGRQLVEALEGHAVSRGMHELWLLTIDADGWFGRHGYVVRDRRDAPPDIQGTAEFSGLCPGDAVLMSKKL